MARRYKKRKGGRRGASAWGMMKGALYVGAVAAPMYQGYQQLGGGADGMVGVVKGAAFMNPRTNQFSFDHGKQIWAPVAVLAVVDLVTSKVGLQRRVAQGVSRLMR